jgi:hypothetical protein
MEYRLQVRPQTIKLLPGKIGRSLYDIDLGNDFLKFFYLYLIFKLLYINCSK